MISMRSIFAVAAIVFTASFSQAGTKETSQVTRPAAGVSHDLIVGVLDFSPETEPLKVAELGEKLKKSDAGFQSLIVAEIHANIYGLYFIYKTNAKVKNEDQFLDSITPVLKPYEKLKTGHHISSSVIAVK